MPEYKRLLMCSGKVYYELAAERAKQKKEKDVAIVRLEQVCRQAARLSCFNAV